MWGPGGVTEAAGWHWGCGVTSVRSCAGYGLFWADEGLGQRPGTQSLGSPVKPRQLEFEGQNTGEESHTERWRAAKGSLVYSVEYSHM